MDIILLLKILQSKEAKKLEFTLWDGQEIRGSEGTWPQLECTLPVPWPWGFPPTDTIHKSHYFYMKNKIKDILKEGNENIYNLFVSSPRLKQNKTKTKSTV